MADSGYGSARPWELSVRQAPPGREIPVEFSPEDAAFNGWTEHAGAYVVLDFGERSPLDPHESEQF